MRDPGAWRPTKYVRIRGRLRADPAHVGYGSRRVADLQGAAYQRLIQQHATGTLVDLGCGAAPLYLEYRERVREVILVDWETSLHPNPCVDVRCDLNRHIALPSESADTILATDVLEHLHRPETFLAESARILRPGGKLLLGVPFLYWIHEQPHDYHRYTEYRLAQLCREAGLVPSPVEVIGGPVEVLLDISAKLAARSALLRLCHRVLGALVRTWAALRRPADELTRAFPLAYALVAEKVER